MKGRTKTGELCCISSAPSKGVPPAPTPHPAGSFSFSHATHSGKPPPIPSIKELHLPHRVRQQPFVFPDRIYITSCLLHHMSSVRISGLSHCHCVPGLSVYVVGLAHGSFSGESDPSLVGLGSTTPCDGRQPMSCPVVWKLNLKCGWLWWYVLSPLNGW